MIRYVALCAAFLAGSSVILAQAGSTVMDGVYSDLQATRGQTLYAAQCSACHGPALLGLSAPPLAGTDFLAAWDARPLSDLVDKIQNTMPASAPGTLTRAQATEISAHLLDANAFPAGAADLSADDMLQQMAMVRAPGAAGDPPSARPPGNLAQVMRGILFPSSNMLFNVQTHDPGAPAEAFSPDEKAFSWVDWGAGIYSGWELVDYAAIALAESAPLMLTPGRRCENGRPVPIDNADWKQFTAELAEAGRAAYRASQSRDQEAVSEVTNQLSDSCLNCHQVYRDKPGGTPADPSNKEARCLP
jgi:mono/diheme cytochrome c family protein